MTGNRSQVNVWIVVILITAVAAALRFAGLGDLGFFGDEETTSFAARALADGYGAIMPSGMPYRRALPITWLSAGVARQFGLEAEFAYRAVPAMLGALAVPLIFLAGRHLAGTGGGIISALLLALSGWHMVWSRTARMYAPLVTALVAFFYLILKWKETGKSRYLIGAATLYLAGVLLHRAGVAVVLFPILLACMRNGDEVSSRDAIIIVVLLGFAGLLVGDMFITTPFNEWANYYALPEQGAGAATAGISAITFAIWALGLIGGCVGAALAWRISKKFPTGTRAILQLALAVTAVLVVAAGFSGWLWAAVTLAVCWLVMIRVIPTTENLLPGPGVLALLAIGAAPGILIRLAANGWTVKALAITPFPYLPYLGKLLPLMIGGLLVMTVALIVLRPRAGDQAFRASVLFVWIYALLVGFDVDYAPWRYLFPMYPWIVLAAAGGIVWAIDVVAARSARLTKPILLAAASAIIIAGGIGGHGLPSALQVLQVQYGERVEWYDQGLIGRPDHRSAGLYVRQRLQPGDIVIAEDPLQQRWYAGQVDYWFRSLGDAGRYLRKEEDGSLRDIYVSSELLADPPAEDWLTRPDRSVWLITSLETGARRDLYLEDDQIQWLADLEAEASASHVGLDGLTSVYCFGACPDATVATDPRRRPVSRLQ